MALEVANILLQGLSVTDTACSIYLEACGDLETARSAAFIKFDTGARSHQFKGMWGDGMASLRPTYFIFLHV